jgi:GT2 family glycosyltransferase
LNSGSRTPTQIRVAVLLTCHNRREKTLSCLRLLFEQQLPEDTAMTVFLVDDGSTDGTGASIRSEFPQVRILDGDGSLFWSGGMRWAFAEALKEDFDYNFWLNDDSFLDPSAINLMIATHRRLAARGDKRSIVVGSMRDPDSGHLTYGGEVRNSRIHPLKFKLLPPADVPLECDTFNGNAVLIPREVANIAGNISSSFTHSMGDTDYGLRARKLGCSLWIAPGFVGSCSCNDVKNTFLDANLPLRERLRKMLTMKGLPAREYFRFARAHGGLFWWVFGGLPYMRVMLQSLLSFVRPKSQPVGSSA